MTTFTKNDVQNMSGPELVAAFNKITGENVKRFSSRPAGIKRVLSVLDQQKPAPVKKTKKAGTGGGRRKLTVAQAEEIRVRRADGEKVKDLAEEFGVSIYVIYDVTYGRRYREINGPTTDPTKAPRVTTAMREKALELDDAGQTIEEIAKELGISKDLVNDVLNRIDWSVR
ncbi:MAG: hypothetical protein CMJ75_18705 [Planctomycetaceae bacterium]|nr:hypothetical protein [Planctomycetaceae bacterium]